MTAIKKGTITFKEGAATKVSIFLPSGDTLSLENYFSLMESQGVPAEEIQAELARVFGNIPLTTTGKDETPVKEPSLKKVYIKNITNVEHPAPAYAVEPFVPVGEVTLMGGHGGAGKSILALIQGAHYAAGVPWFGFVVKGGRVLYVSLEDPANLIKYRLKRIIETYDLPVEAIEKNLTILDGSESGAALMVESSEYGIRSLTRTQIMDEVEEAAQGCGLIIIDNASDAFDGEENQRRQVRRFIRELRGIAKKNQAGLILLAHIDKQAARFGANGNTYSGSTAWHNSVRSRLALTEKNGHVELVQEKLNVGKKLDRPISLTWVDGVLIPDSNITERLDTEGQVDLDKAAVLTAIQKAISDGVDVPTARTGPKTTHGTLERFPDLPNHLRGARVRENFYAALTTLHREGALQVEEYTTPARHVRERFICADSVAPNNTPYTPTPEPAKLAHGPARVKRVAPITLTGETGETGAEDVLEVLG